MITRVVRAGGCAAVCVLVLDIARMEHFPDEAMPGPTGTAAAAAAAARRTRGPDDPLALRNARIWQCLAAGPLTAGTAALMIPFLTASWSVRTETGGMTDLWALCLVVGPLLGLAVGSIAAMNAAKQPPRQPPREPRPGGSRSGGAFVKI